MFSLALLDYVSRAHEIKLRPSVRRPSVASIILPLAQHYQKVYLSWERRLRLGCDVCLARHYKYSDFKDLVFIGNTCATC